MGRVRSRCRRRRVGHGTARAGSTRGTGDRDATETPEWSASDEAKAFIAGSSELWAEAAIASGDDPDAAAAAAARTTAAYTG